MNKEIFQLELGNSGSLENNLKINMNQTPEGMVASAEYNIKYLEDFRIYKFKSFFKSKWCLKNNSL